MRTAGIRSLLACLLGLVASGCGWLNDRLAPTLNRSPTADFTWTLCPCRDLLVTFNATAHDNDEADGGIRVYLWDFGDGSSPTESGPQPLHRFAQAGRYLVRLVVTDNDNSLAFKTRDVDVF